MGLKNGNYREDDNHYACEHIVGKGQIIKS